MQPAERGASGWPLEGPSPTFLTLWTQPVHPALRPLPSTGRRGGQHPLSAPPSQHTHAPQLSVVAPDLTGMPSSRVSERRDYLRSQIILNLNLRNMPSRLFITAARTQRSNGSCSREKSGRHFEHHLSVNLTVCTINALAVTYRCADGLASGDCTENETGIPHCLAVVLVAATTNSAITLTPLVLRVKVLCKG